MLKAIIKPTGHVNGTYPTYYIENDGVNVGPAGELTLVAAFADKESGWNGTPVEFRIYAPGTWAQVDVEQVND